MKVIVKRPFYYVDGIHRIGETAEVADNVFDSELMEKVADEKPATKKEKNETVEDAPAQKKVIKKGAKNA